jgi:exodeoxyribonuclease-5
MERRHRMFASLRQGFPRWVGTRQSHARGSSRIVAGWKASVAAGKRSINASLLEYVVSFIPMPEAKPMAEAQGALMTRSRLITTMNNMLDCYTCGIYAAVDEHLGIQPRDGADRVLSAFVDGAAAANQYLEPKAVAALQKRHLDPSAATQLLFGSRVWRVSERHLHEVLRIRNGLHHRDPAVCESRHAAVKLADVTGQVLQAVEQPRFSSQLSQLGEWVQSGMRSAAVQDSASRSALPSVQNRTCDEVHLTAEQLDTLAAIKKWWERSDGRQFVVAGEAGSGKTTVLAALLQAIDLGANRVLLAAPTTKAREMLRSKLPHRGTWRSRLKTIHSIVWRYDRPVYDGEDAVFTKRGFKDPQADRGLKGVELVVVDEASMVTEEMHQNLLEHYRVVYFGDPDQLPPVIHDEAVDRPAEVLSSPDARLKTIHRQADKSPILQAAARARAGEQLEFFEWTDDRVTMLHELQDGIGTKELDDLLRGHDVALAGRNITRIAANQRARVARGYVEHPLDHIPKPGELLVACETQYDALGGRGINNGERLRVLEVCSRVVVRQRGEEDVQDLSVLVEVEGTDVTGQVIISSEMLSGVHVRGSQIVTRDVSGPRSNVLRCEWGYAVTVHKAQGSEWPSVLVLDDGMIDDRVQRSRWNYVAYTRAIDQLTVVKLAPRTRVFG